MADYESYKPTLNDVDYANKINDFIDAVAVDINSKLSTSDFVFKEIISTSIDYAVLVDDNTIEIDANISNVTITLPDAATNKGRILIFRRKDVTTYRCLIESIYELYVQNESVTIQSNGTTWVRIG